MRQAILLLVTTFALSFTQASSAPLKQMSEVNEPIGQTLEAGVGDTILTIHLRESMPNLFGGADIFGRTRPTGTVTLQFLGMEGTFAKFVRNGVTIDSGLTTTNSTPLIIPHTTTSNTTGMIGATPIYGTTMTNGAPTVVPAHPPAATEVPQSGIIIQLDTSKERTLLVAGRMIQIIDVTPTTIAYQIQ